MADKKISALTAASTPLAGTEVLPIVQSGATVKVANNDLRPKQIQSNATSGVLQIAGPAAAATRVMTTPDANFTAARTDAAQTFTGNQTITSTASRTTVVNNNNSTYSSGNATNAFEFEATTSYGNHYIAGINALTYGGSYGSGALTFITRKSSDGSNSVSFTLDNAGNAKIDLGNLIQGTAAKGINFTANSAAAGMTSQLLNWYEEGTWTPVVSSTGGSGVITTYTSSGTYTRIGRLVTATARILLTNIGTAAGSINVAGIPFTSASTSTMTVAGNENAIVGYVISGNASSSTAFNFAKYDGSSPLANNAAFTIAVTYLV